MTEVEKKWWLTDAEERQRQYPETFELPSRDLRLQLRRGDTVKLGFEFKASAETEGCHGERMWVQVASVKKRLEGPLYIGTLANEPFFLDDCLKMGDEVIFEAKHVMDVEH